MLAMEKARLLAAEGADVLLLCFNRPLAAYLDARADGFRVRNFHGLCADLCRDAGLTFAAPEDPAEASRETARTARTPDVDPGSRLEPAAPEAPDVDGP